MEPTVTVQFLGLVLNAMGTCRYTHDNPCFQLIKTAQHDDDIDGADWKWNWKLEHLVLKTGGSFIQVISPMIAIPKVNSPVF
jgi:hypothetical protein